MREPSAYQMYWLLISIIVGSELFRGVLIGAGIDPKCARNLDYVSMADGKSPEYWSDAENLVKMIRLMSDGLEEKMKWARGDNFIEKRAQ